MADWQTYHDSDLPISVPPVDLAWQDMQSRLDREKRRPMMLWSKLAMTLALLLSWLVILEPVRYKGNPVAARSAAGNEISNSSASTRQENTTQTKDLANSSDLFEYPSQSTNKQNRKQKTKAQPNKNGGQDIHEPASTGSMVDDVVSPELAQEKTTPKASDTLAVKPQKNTDTISSVIAAPDEDKKKEEDDWKIRFGPQWELQIPTTGFNGYFDGPSVKPEPWRNLIPGLWLEAAHGKNAIHFSFMPMQQQMVSDKTFRIQNSLIQNPDTTISREETKHIYKLLGMSASIGYARNLRGNWWGGLNLQASWWQQALAQSDVQDSYIVSGQVVDTRPSTYAYKVTDEWSYFNKMQTFMMADLTYRKQRWQSGLRSGIALTPFSKGDGPSNKFRGSVFFRWSFGK
jgi:hypothetical protein